jgi:hypothetical protein
MRQILKPNAELELLTSGELAELLDRTRNEMTALAPLELPGLWGPANTGAGGGFRAEVYEVPAGYTCRLHLLSVSCAYTVGTPAAQAVASIYVWRNEAPEDGGARGGLLSVGSGIPNVLELNSAAAPVLRGGERVLIEVRGGPVGAELSGTFQVALQPVAARVVAATGDRRRPGVAREPHPGLSHTRDSEQDLAELDRGAPLDPDYH